MTTENTRFDQPGLKTRRRSIDRLWQVPVFMMGLAVLGSVWLCRPLWRLNAAEQIGREVVELRRLVEQENGDPARTLALGEKLLKKSNRFPDSAAAVHFLLGSFLLKQAEPSNGFLPRALTNLEAANAAGVAQTDLPKLLYRLGTARYQTGKAPQSVIDCLAPSVGAADEPALGYEMLAESYLKLKQPDLTAALAANKKRLALPTLNDELLAPARLLHGDLLLRLDRSAEARDVLSRIGDKSPEKIRKRARFLLAQSCQEEERWAEAAKLWETLLSAGAPYPEKPGRILCYLGICQRQLGNNEKASQAWEKALNDEGEAGQAAAFALAEIRLFDKTPEAAFAHYERALRDVVDAAGYRNSLVELKEARRLVERGIDRFRQTEAYDKAFELAHLYEKIAAEGTAQLRLAEVADAWAEHQLALGEVAEAQKHYRQAGEAYQALALATKQADQQALYLRQSAERFAQADEFTLALEVMKSLLEVETDPERLGAGWFTTAGIYLALKQDEAALAAYRKCIEFPGVNALRARYRLALHDIDMGNYDDAQEALKQNLELLRLQSDAETHEKSLFTLAELLYRRGDYRRASDRLQEALDHYPGNAEAFKARWHLAESYRRLAEFETRQLSSPQLAPDVRLHHREQYRKWLNMALANYQKLAYDLAAHKSNNALTPEQETVLRQADFAIGECQINLGQYTDAVRLYEILAARYHHQVEHLLALRQVWRCYWIQREPDRARAVVKKVGSVLNQMGDGAFTNHPSKQTRQEWKDWIDWAQKQ